MGLEEDILILVNQLARTVELIKRNSSRQKSHLAVNYLRSIQSCSNKLFDSAGKLADSVLVELNEIKDEIQTLQAIVPDEKSRIVLYPPAVETVLNAVSALERSWDFQYSLWLQKSEVAKRFMCSFDQLSYGSTSFELWSEVFAMSPLQLIEADPTMCIYGSSLGTLAFFMIEYFPSAAVHGYEIIPLLYEGALELKTLAYPTDMLTSDISDVHLVVLTSLCWDEDTRRKVARKLSLELREGSIVIDYRADTFSSSGLAYKGEDIEDSAAVTACVPPRRQFIPCGSKEGSCSWSSTQRIYVYKAV